MSSLLCFSGASAQAGKIVFVDSIRVPWISSGASLTPLSNYRTAKLAPWYGLGFRAGAWGAPVYMDTSLMNGGSLHFRLRAQKIRTFAVWLAGDDSGAMAAVTIQTDTAWKDYDLSWSSLNAKKRRVNSFTVQNNGGDSNTVSIADVRFVPRQNIPVFLPSPPRLRVGGIRDSTVFHGDIYFTAFVYDTTRLSYLQLFFDTTVVGTLGFDPSVVKRFSVTPPSDFGSIPLSKDSLLALSTIYTSLIPSGMHRVAIKAEDINGASVFAPTIIFIAHDTLLVSVTAADSMRIRAQLLSQIPDSIRMTVAVPKPKP